MSDYAIVPVYARGRVATFALCDPEDLDVLGQFLWTTSPLHRKTAELGYAAAAVDGVRVAMHRLVLGLGKGDAGIVHHLNHHKRDNRRANLHVCESRAEHGFFHSRPEFLA